MAKKTDEAAAEPTPEPTPEPVVHAVAMPPSVLDRVRANRMGPLAVALGVAVATGLLLSTLVPTDPNVLALGILGALVSAAVGFVVRYLSLSHGWRTQAIALVATVLGVHIMATTGMVNGAGGGTIGGLVTLPNPDFGDALLMALALPAVSSGAILAGLTAAIIAGWSARSANDSEN